MSAKALIWVQAPKARRAYSALIALISKALVFSRWQLELELFIFNVFVYPLPLLLFISEIKVILFLFGPPLPPPPSCINFETGLNPSLLRP